MTPSYALNITPQKKVTFTTKSEDFEGNLWEIYPKKGSITDVSYKEEGDFSVYTRHLSSFLFVGCTRSPQSHSLLCSRGFTPLPP
ncbi:hypothetical protein [Photorhabdus laumondii]|uniref:hypothetical protein n=1 Tax=Photorhabdus laumondii TaxID=2218628 RepID=UPI0025B101E6|nr:hypothetical protein [Photorhabdus laumondii]